MLFLDRQSPPGVRQNLRVSMFHVTAGSDGYRRAAAFGKKRHSTITANSGKAPGSNRIAPLRSVSRTPVSCFTRRALAGSLPKGDIRLSIVMTDVRYVRDDLAARDALQGHVANSRLHRGVRTHTAGAATAGAVPVTCNMRSKSRRSIRYRQNETFAGDSGENHGPGCQHGKMDAR